MDKKDMKKFFVIQYVIIGLLIVLCLFLIFDRNSNSSKNNGQTEKVSNDYDISMMNEVEVSDVLDMFEDKELHILYIGRETCGVCKAILPNLQKAQDDLNYITQYLDITEVDRSSSDWEKLEKLLDIETSVSITNDEGKKELKAETFGYFIGTYGYTPTMVIINNNNMVAGHIGNMTLDELENWLKSNGVA